MKKIIMRNIIKIIFTYIIIIMINTSLGFALNEKSIIAFPVPFNHNIHPALNIGYTKGVTADSPVTVKIAIFDINGSTVFTGGYSAFPIIWNGRNNSGRLAKPGLYIIKITIDNTTTGEHGVKIIRILVQG
jgi:hypothetical protein